MANKREEEFYPVALTVAGSDSGGGAGIQADLRTFNAAGVFGCSVITALTAQNPRKVAAVAPTAPEMVAAQMDAVLEAIAVKALKTGMLATEKIIHVVAERLRKCKIPVVVDPVMISTSGARLLEESAMESLKSEILPAASLVTPNLPEAEWLLGTKLASPDEFADAAREIASRWHIDCLLKTGHSANGVKGRALDYAVLDGKLYALSTPLLADLPKFASHGTGCSLSAAIAASLASGMSKKDALRASKAYVFGALSEMAHIGKELEAMYPPLEDYSREVSLKCLEQGADAPKRGGKR